MFTYILAEVATSGKGKRWSSP